MLDYFEREMVLGTSKLVRLLRSARRMPMFLSRWIWVDALCIDQGHLRERQHQVQQMGLIYSKATEVISWLGNDRSISSFLVDSRIDAGTHGQLNHVSKAPENCRAFCTSTYWNRAWITQEIALASYISLMACDEVLGFHDLPPDSRDIPPEYATLLDQLKVMRHDLRSPLMRAEQLKYPTEGKSLIYLLDRFRSKECQITRDRVFSLLALCRDGQNVEVDYGATDLELAFNILHACRQSFCLCSISVIGDALRITPRPWLEPDLKDSNIYADLPYTAEIELPILWDNNSHHPLVDCGERSCVGRRKFANCRGWSPGNIVRCRPPHNEEGDPPFTTITLELYRLCPVYLGHIVFQIDATNPRFAYQYFGKFHVNGWDPLHSDRGLQIYIRDEAETCTVKLTLEFCFHLAVLAQEQSPWNTGPEERKECCDRVAHQYRHYPKNTYRSYLRIT